MLQGNHDCCLAAGILPNHGTSIASVADRSDTIISFRDPGPLAAGLVAENYAMKSFRLHAKSCDWGPMAGLVCMDPRLSKSPDRNANSNREQNRKALHGDLEEGMVIRQNFSAGVVPLVISKMRLMARISQGIPSQAGGGSVYSGTASSGTVFLPWIAIPIPWGDLERLQLVGERHRYPVQEYYGLFVNRDVGGFDQDYLGTVRAVHYSHNKLKYEWLMGMTNPNCARGFKDCVTADLDLFSVWPSKGLRNKAKLHPGAASAGGAGHLDARPLQYTGQEYAQMGNISERVQYIAFEVNDAIQRAGYLGGSACTHSDEAQNPYARNLVSCFPPSAAGVIFFLPRLAAGLMRMSQVVLVQSPSELRQLARKASDAGYYIDLKPSWLAA